MLHKHVEEKYLKKNEENESPNSDQVDGTNLEQKENSRITLKRKTPLESSMDVSQKESSEVEMALKRRKENSPLTFK